MEDNKNTSAVEAPAAERTAQEPTVDYKALYEKEKSDREKDKKFASDLKAKLQEKMTEEERTRAAQEEERNHWKEVERNYNLLMTKSSVSKIISENEALAQEISKLFIDGQTTTAINKISEYVELERANFNKKIQEQSLLNNPTPPPAEGGKGTLTQEEFDNMSYQEKVELYNKDIKLYEKFTKQ